MIILTEEELGEIIDLTEDMVLHNGRVNEILPFAEKRMEIINRGKERGKPMPKDKKVLPASKCPDCHKDMVREA